MFYQSKCEAVKTVLGLERWIWDMDAPMGGIEERNEKKKIGNQVDL